MNEEEKILFKELCKFKSNSFDESLLSFATSNVLGKLFFNRMQGVAYGVLKKNKCLNKVSREFRNSLKIAYEYNIEKNESFFKCMNYLVDVLNSGKSQAAVLKGGVLCGIYPEGFRTSNDIDILVKPQDVTAIGNALLKSGFKQGKIENDKFVEASRKEIIASKMLRGETVPYIKEMNLPNMKYLEVDINFSLDYKNGDSVILEDILNKREYKNIKGCHISTLCNEDFFIHLCVHLYKEATTIPWVEMKRDMTLYKYADIYMLLSDMDYEEIAKIFNRAESLGLEKICAYVILHTAELFDLKFSKTLEKANEVLNGDENFLHRVIAPAEKVNYVYCTKDISERFFTENRISDLKEEQQNG